jgi:hypothetical protein
MAASIAGKASAPERVQRKVVVCDPDTAAVISEPTHRSNAFHAATGARRVGTNNKKPHGDGNAPWPFAWGGI